MRWVNVTKAHFNTSLILAFYWSAGKLYVYWHNATDYEWYSDPDREDYLRLCRALGVAPVEEDSDG